MTDTEIIEWVQLNEVNVDPVLDDRGLCIGWVASCSSYVGWGKGDDWRQAAQNLKVKMEANE